MNLTEMALVVFIGWAGGLLGLFLLSRRAHREQKQHRAEPRQPKEYDDDDATALAADAADTDAQYRRALARAKRRRAELRARLESELWPDSGESDGDGGAGN